MRRLIPIIFLSGLVFCGCNFRTTEEKVELEKGSRYLDEYKERREETETPPRKGTIDILKSLIFTKAKPSKILDFEDYSFRTRYHGDIMEEVYLVDLRGIFKNISGRDIKYCSIYADLFDKSKTFIETIPVKNVYDLNAGERRSFQSTIESPREPNRIRLKTRDVKFSETER